MNHFLRKCVEEFEQVSTEIGLLPALLYTTLIIIMTVVGIVFVLILGIMALVLSPFVLATIFLAPHLSRSVSDMPELKKTAQLDPWLSE